jgi:hypothetical protein
MIDIAIMAVTLAIVMIVGLVVMPSYTDKKANSQKSDGEKNSQASAQASNCVLEIQYTRVGFYP